MGSRRLRLSVAFLVIIGATLFASGGSAGNRTAEVTFQALPGDSVTYGESYATTTSFTNTGNSMFTQVQLRQLVPTGASGSASLVTSSCGAVIEGNEAVCTFGKLSSGGTLTATLVWGAPASGAGCDRLSDDGRHMAHQGREADQLERGVRVPGRCLLGIAARRRRVAGEEEGRRLRDARRRSRDVRLRGRQPAHEPGAHERRPGLLDGLPARHSRSRRAASSSDTRRRSPRPRRGPRTARTRSSGSPSSASRTLGQSCVDGYTPVNWGTTNKARHIFKILESALSGPKTITKVFHNAAELPKCSANPTFAQGCVVSITPPASSSTRSESSSTHSPPTPRIWTVVADAPINGPWNW